MEDIGKEMSKESNRISFNRFSELKKLVIIYVLVLAWPSQKGADYADLLILVFFDITKTEVNRILYKYTKVFNPNLNNNKVPSWTAIPNSIESEFPKNKVENKEYIDNYSELIDQVLNKTLNGSKTTIEDYKKSEITKVQTNLKVDIFKHLELRDWQRTAYEKWIKNKKKGFIIASRRTGKTFLAQNIAKEHVLNTGPVIVLVNTYLEIDKWKHEIDKFNKESKPVKSITLSSNVNDILSDNTILVSTFSNLSRVRFKNDNILLIVEHLETLNKEFGEILNQNYKFRIAFANSKPDTKFIERTTKTSYFGDILVEYTFTESMLDELIQRFKINFIPCNIDIDDSMAIINTLLEVKSYYPELPKDKWLDLYKIRKHYLKNDTDVFFIEELIVLLQIIKSKTEYVENKIKSLINLNKTVIFCENSYAIKKIHKSLDLVGINHLIYSNNVELNKWSQSPNSWKDEKVLLTDHIEYFSNYELGEIDYSIILGCAGNSNHLKSKIETIISDNHCNKDLIIDVLYLQDTFEDPYKEKEAYKEFKDYLKIEDRNEKVKKNVEKKINIYESKILVCYSDNYISFKNHLSLIEQNLRVDQGFFKTINISKNQSISELKNLIITKDYSDVYIIVDKNDDIITELNQLDIFNNEIKIEIILNENANLANLFKFVIESNKYKHLRKIENKS